MIYRIANDRGFTLLEVIMATSLLGLIMGACVSLIFAAQKHEASAALQQAAELEAKIALNRIVEDMVDVKSDTVFIKDSVTTPPNNHSEIDYKKLEDLAGSLSGTFGLRWVSKGDGVGELRRLAPNGTVTVLARNVLEKDTRISADWNGINFKLTGNKLSISISVQKKQGNRQVVVNYQTVLYLKPATI